MLKNISFRIEIFKEGDQYIGLCPELNVSSFDDTVEEAKKSIKEAVELFLEECEEAGTLEAVLEESGFHKMDKPQEGWVTREPIIVEKVSMAAI